MVWIHGGAYQTGCTAEKEFDGSALARRGVVVVSVGYRLNVFGFLAHNRLREEAEARHDDEPYANFAATGDPNGPDADGTPLPEWTRYAPFGGDAMRLGQRTRMIRDWSTNVERNALLQWGGAAAD